MEVKLYFLNIFLILTFISSFEAHDHRNNQNIQIEKELIKIELSHENTAYILTLGKIKQNLIFILDEKFPTSINYYMASLNYNNFTALGKSFRLCDNSEEVEENLIFYIKNIIDQVDGYSLKVNWEKNDSVELKFDILLVNKSHQFAIQLNKIYKSVEKQYNEVKKMLKIYMDEYGTEILKYKSDRNPIYGSIDKLINNEDIKLINEGLIKKCNKKIKTMKLLYKASRDGDLAENFHSHCDNILNTLTIVKTTKNRKFGGFTSQSWGNNNNFNDKRKKKTQNNYDIYYNENYNYYKNDNTAFIFSLDDKKIYYQFNNIYNFNSQSSIFISKNQGPTFGKGYDLFISSGCLKNNLSFDGTPSTYDTGGEMNTLNNGERYFTVKDYEVYELILE